MYRADLISLLFYTIYGINSVSVVCSHWNVERWTLNAQRDKNNILQNSQIEFYWHAFFYAIASTHTHTEFTVTCCNTLKHVRISLVTLGNNKDAFSFMVRLLFNLWSSCGLKKSSCFVCYYSHLAQNPFICDCNLKWLADYLRSNPIETSGARCTSPRRLANKRIGQIKSKKFRCSGTKLKFNGTVQYSTTSALSCDVSL